MQIGSAPGAPAQQQGAALADPQGLGAGVLAGPTLLAGWASDTPPPPSRGSKNHFQGQCRPCRFAPEKCPNGEGCNFCHFPHGEEKLSEVEAFSAKARQRRQAKALENLMNSCCVGGARPAPPCAATSTSSSWEGGLLEGQPGQQLPLCDHLDLAGSWAGCYQQRAGGGAELGGGSELVEAGKPGHVLGSARGAERQAIGAEDREGLQAMLLSAQPEHYDDNVKSMIEHMPGGYDTRNTTVRTELRRVVENSIFDDTGDEGK